MLCYFDHLLDIVLVIFGIWGISSVWFVLIFVYFLVLVVVFVVVVALVLSRFFYFLLSCRLYDVSWFLFTSIDDEVLWKWRTCLKIVTLVWCFRSLSRMLVNHTTTSTSHTQQSSHSFTSSMHSYWLGFYYY